MNYLTTYTLAASSFPSMPVLNITIRADDDQDAKDEATRIVRALVKADYSRFGLYRKLHTENEWTKVCDLNVRVHTSVEFA